MVLVLMPEKGLRDRASNAVVLVRVVPARAVVRRAGRDAVGVMPGPAEAVADTGIWRRQVGFVGQVTLSVVYPKHSSRCKIAWDPIWRMGISSTMNFGSRKCRGLGNALVALEQQWWDTAADQPRRYPRQAGPILCRKSHPAPFETHSEVSGGEASANVAASGSRVGEDGSAV